MQISSSNIKSAILFSAFQVVLATFQDLKVPPGVEIVNAGKYLDMGAFQALLDQGVHIAHISALWAAM